MKANALIFDYGGTLDTAGRHWGRMMERAYKEIGVGITPEQFRETYVFTERRLGNQSLISPIYTFRQTLNLKLSLQIEYLVDHRMLQIPVADRTALKRKMLTMLYDDVVECTRKSRNILAELHAQCPLALVSNFYGNLSTVLQEFQLADFFKVVIESAEVGFRKPDPMIFRIALNALGCTAQQVAIIGDSYKNDIAPALQLDAKAIWLKGEGWHKEEEDETGKAIIIHNLSELLTLRL